jgi:thioredoxin 1
MSETDLMTLTDETFSTAISGRTPIVVDFWAEWCPPCGPMARTLAELAPEFAGKLRIAKLNGDENPRSMRAYRVLSLPTLLFFADGQLTGQLVGMRPKSVLRQALENVAIPYANA